MIIPYNIIRAKNRTPIVQFYFMNQKWFVEFDETTKYFDAETFKRRLVNDWLKYNYNDFTMQLMSDLTTSVAEYEIAKNGRYYFTNSSNLRGV